MTNSLVAFWDKAPLETAPYVHPHDHAAPKGIRNTIDSRDRYLEDWPGSPKNPGALHLGLLPQPYHGDLDGAEILILLLNPGVSDCDYHAEAHYPEFRADLLATIRQERRSHMFLDPKWAWTSGFTWWERKLRGVTWAIADEHFGGNYRRALANVARHVASIELIPYHSSSFAGSTKRPSANAAREFVSKIAQDPRRIIIIPRSVEHWNLPDLPNITKYPGHHARSASLGMSSKGGEAIIERFRKIDLSYEI